MGSNPKIDLKMSKVGLEPIFIDFIEENRGLTVQFFCVLKFNPCTFKLSVFLCEPNVNLKSSRSRSNFVFSVETDDSKE